jgi:diguanylate cyclase (GGDEF)-like protein
VDPTQPSAAAGTVRAPAPAAVAVAAGLGAAAMAVLAGAWWGPDAAAALLQSLAELGAAVACAVVARRAAGRERRAWALFAAGLAAWGLTDLVLLVAGRGVVPGGVTLLDAGWLAFYPPMLAGVAVLYALLHPEDGWTGLLDAGALAIAAGYVALTRLPAGGAGAAADAVNLAYPMLDMAALIAVGWLALRAGAALPGFMRWVVAAFALQVAAGLALIVAPAGTLVSGGVYALAGCLWIVAAVGRLRAGPVRAASRRGPAPVWAGAASLAGLALLVAAVPGGLRGGGLVVLALVLAAAAVRMMGAMIANRRMAERMSLMATTDALTGLPNRRALREHLDEAVAAARERQGRLAVAVLDLDHFKRVNDALGHPVGDRLLVAVARRLAAVTRPGDMVARMGGDEFVLLLGEVDGAAEAVAWTQQAVAAVTASVPLDGLEVDVEVSAGVAVYPDHGTTGESLLQHADTAMYTAKGPGQVAAVYRPEDDPHSREGLALAGDLRRAIERGELELHFQPKVARPSGTLVGVEALVRWRHPERGLLMPGAFIPLAEQGGAIRPLTLWVLDAALAQHRAWERAGTVVPVAVNLSVRLLLDPSLPREVARLLAERHVPPERLELELTEHALLTDAGRARRVLERLSATGVRLAVDDFGTGHASLPYLRQLPVDVLKIDRSLVQGVPGIAEDVSIVRAILDLARNLGLETVAEGVEETAQLDLLDRLGCDVVQGYLIGRPVPAPELDLGPVSLPATTSERRPR